MNKSLTSDIHSYERCKHVTAINKRNEVKMHQTTLNRKILPLQNLLLFSLNNLKYKLIFVNSLMSVHPLVYIAGTSLSASTFFPEAAALCVMKNIKDWTNLEQTSSPVRLVLLVSKPGSTGISVGEFAGVSLGECFDPTPHFFHKKRSSRARNI